VFSIFRVLGFWVGSGRNLDCFGGQTVENMERIK
jgi:hypothetical protein